MQNLLLETNNYYGKAKAKQYLKKTIPSVYKHNKSCGDQQNPPVL